MELEDLFTAGNYKMIDQKISIYRCIFDGKTKELWRHYSNKQTVENTEKPIGERLEPRQYAQTFLTTLQKRFLVTSGQQQHVLRNVTCKGVSVCITWTLRLFTND